ncbi:mediator of RNA polymerase II transcription subunit 32 [Selaginella moellendorffii]|nr:mediator of RNA polymerase II transcription subunit 32 [Selaginella moellendorffii]|eukprot:XP_002976322.2 mediator of RNA polymerase II transcription subunit 32 [Selaginella moellendorffii]
MPSSFVLGFFISRVVGMDPILQALQDSYHRLLAACAAALEAKEVAAGERSERTDKALNSFLESHQLFHGACDRAQEFVESVRQRIGSECLVDEATGPVSGRVVAGDAAKAGGGGAAVAPLSAVRLEQLSKAVRWQVIDLQQGGGGGALSNAAGGSLSAVGQAPGAIVTPEDV